MGEYLTEFLSLIIGSFIGFFLSLYFHKKNERSSNWLANNLESIYLGGKFPDIFQNVGAYYRNYMNDAPKNKDIPHLREIRCNTNQVHQNSNLFVLFRMIDLGYNFPYNKGIEIINNLNQYNIPAFRESFGWYYCNVNIPLDAPLGNHKLIFNFKDTKENKNTQEFEYCVIANE